MHKLNRYPYYHYYHNSLHHPIHNHHNSYHHHWGQSFRGFHHWTLKVISWLYWHLWLLNILIVKVMAIVMMKTINAIVIGMEEIVVGIMCKPPSGANRLLHWTQILIKTYKVWIYHHLEILGENRTQVFYMCRYSIKSMFVHDLFFIMPIRLCKKLLLMLTPPNSAISRIFLWQK